VDAGDGENMVSKSSFYDNKMIHKTGFYSCSPSNVLPHESPEQSGMEKDAARFANVALREWRTMRGSK